VVPSPRAPLPREHRSSEEQDGAQYLLEALLMDDPFRVPAGREFPRARFEPGQLAIEVRPGLAYF
jgi:hypothetical protein